MSLVATNQCRRERARRWCARALVTTGAATAAWCVSVAAAEAGEPAAAGPDSGSDRESIVDVVDELVVTDRIDDLGDMVPPDQAPVDDQPLGDADADTEADERGDTVPEAGEMPADTLRTAYDSIVAVVTDLITGDIEPPRDEDSPAWDEWGQRIRDVLTPPVDGIADDLDPSQPPLSPATPARGLPLPEADQQGVNTDLAGGVEQSGNAAARTAIEYLASAAEVGPGAVLMDRGSSWPAPAGTPAVPSALGHFSSAGAGQTDGCPLAIVGGWASWLDDDEPGSARLAARNAPRSLGCQPGVTPD